MKKHVSERCEEESSRGLGLGVVLALAALLFILPAWADAATNPVPFIDQPITPTAAAPGSASATLRVRGGGFVSSSTVNWNGSPLATTVVSNRQLSATVPSSDLAAPGTASVTVVNPAPGGGTSNVVFFQVVRRTSPLIMPQSDNSLDVDSSFVLTGDFNHDGLLDVASLSAAPAVVAVLLGNGNGTFQAPVDYSVGTTLNPSGFAMGDFNGDGNLDFAIVAENAITPGIVTIMLGNADGTFQPPLPSIPVNGAPACIATADVNGDGRLDLVVGYQYADDGFLSVLLGNGDGTFGLATDYAAGKYTTSLLLADFNKDGIVDIATVDQFGSDASVLLGNGDGTFGLPSVFYNQFPLGITGADFNGDGLMDIAVSSSFGGTIMLGNGNGTFRQGSGFSSGGNDTTQSVTVGDFNADGKLDVALPSTTGSVAVAFGNGDGTFQSPIVLPLAGNHTIPVPTWVATGDFNQDGHLDLAVADSNGMPGAVSVLLQSTLQVTPTIIRLPNTVVGATSHAATVKLLNFGGSTVSLGTISVTGAEAAEFPISTGCGSTLASGQTCMVTVPFSPTAAGSQSATLSIPNATLGLTQSVSLSGEGTVVSLSPAGLNFGSVTVGQTSAPLTATLTNAGTTSLTITNIIINGSNPGDFAETNNCGASLGAGSSCTISITFTPAAGGSRSGRLFVYDNSTGSPQIVALAGTGI
jgi:hypothetical protein